MAEGLHADGPVEPDPGGEEDVHGAQRQGHRERVAPQPQLLLVRRGELPVGGDREAPLQVDLRDQGTEDLAEPAGGGARPPPPPPPPPRPPAPRPAAPTEGRTPR